jgi:hypothetical protein
MDIVAFLEQTDTVGKIKFGMVELVLLVKIVELIDFGMEYHVFQLLILVQMDFYGMAQFVFKIHLYAPMIQHGMVIHVNLTYQLQIVHQGIHGTEYRVNQQEMLIAQLDQIGMELLVLRITFIAQQVPLGMEMDVRHQQFNVHQELFGME